MASTNCVLTRGLVYNIFLGGCATVLISFTKTKVLGYGHMIHPIFHWEDSFTPLIAIGCLIFSCFSYILLCKADEMFKFKAGPAHFALKRSGATGKDVSKCKDN